MKKISKVLALFLVIILLTACTGWSDVKDYSNFTCVYQAETKLPVIDSSSLFIRRIALKKTDTELSAGVGTPEEKNKFDLFQVLINSDESVKVKERKFYGSNFIFDTDVMESLGKTYTQNKTCPQNVYFKGQSNNKKYTLSTNCVGDDYCYTFNRDDNLSTSDLSDTDNNRFSWTCEYSFGSGVKVKFKVYNLEARFIKNTELVNNVAHNYVTAYYMKGGSYVPLSGAVKDFDGSAGTGWTNPSLSNSVNSSAFIKNSIKNEKISCPTVYLESFDALSCSTVTDYILTMFDKSYHCDGFTEFPNTKVNLTNMTCKNETTGASSSNCDTVVTHEDLHDEDEVECKYSSGYGTKFAFNYSKSKNTLTYDPLTTGFKAEIINADGLKSQFATTSNHDHCPTYIACKAFNQTSRKQIFIAPYGTAEFADPNDNNKLKNFDKNCGILNGENGQEVTDPTEHYVLELEESNLDISEKLVPCNKLMGDNLVAVLHLFITALRIAGAIIAIISGMLALIPAVASDNADALKKATKKCIYLAIILVVIGILPTIINVIGKIAGFDLTCLKG